MANIVSFIVGADPLSTIRYALEEYMISEGSGRVTSQVLRDLYAIDAAAEAETWEAAREQMVPLTQPFVDSAQQWVECDNSPVSRATLIAAQAIRDTLSARLGFNDRVVDKHDARNAIEAARVHVVGLRVEWTLQRLNWSDNDDTLSRKEVRIALSDMRRELNLARQLQFNCRDGAPEWVAVADNAVRKIAAAIEEASGLLAYLKS